MPVTKFLRYFSLVVAIICFVFAFFVLQNAGDITLIFSLIILGIMELLNSYHHKEVLLLEEEVYILKKGTTKTNKNE